MNLTASRHILPIANYLDRRGEPLEPLLLRAGLPATCLDDPQKLMPTAALWRFRELAADRTGDPNLTFSVIKPLALNELGRVAKTLLRAPTLKKAIQTFARLTYVESTTAHIQLTPYRAGETFLSVQFTLGRVRGEWQAELYLLMWLLKIVGIADPDFSPKEVWCMECATPDRRRIIESLGARARFNQQMVGFPIPTPMLALPIHRTEAGRSPGVAEDELWSTAPSDSASGALRQLIKAYSDDRWLSLSEASDALGISGRGLQRNLAAEATTFSTVLEGARAELARDLLMETDLSLTGIARRLGYSSLSNFNRAFQRWAAVLPSEYRVGSRTANASRAAPHRDPS
ncbi:MAG: AraC family transcriptional regulator ligand-binding domain-containing protein [Deltaproteobacteria bacterium]|nr:AraC family transcriptional regulator ligand-binding domain-containing protein [Deltaproteobacteria bacterium]MBW2498716.1 AraC family transcriptional regulator ligand-binding domain-containing protein [Deltaproteobacteria bacterium]